jgi:high affinity Mn2+ porin
MVTQVHDNFPSPYIGLNSLLPNEHSATSLTSTLFLDFRLWEWENYSTELVFNPEISGGRGFSGVLGIAGFPNEEISRVGVPDPTPYIARLYLRQTWGLGGEREKVEDTANQIGGVRDICRVTLSVGKLPPTDVVDDNRYSHDPRTSFLNWALVYNGAWDYPANVRGYNYGIALDINTVYWALRYGIFPEPATANGAPLDPHFAKANGQILEVEERWWLVDRPGKLREWVFLNHAHMGDYLEALQEMPVNPDVTLTRAYRFKYGFGASFEQEITRDLGVFARLGWNDGDTETWAFTAIDRTLAGGLVLNGTKWCRPHDQVGLAGILNGLAADHRAYLAAGGLDFIIGDGRLRYAPSRSWSVSTMWKSTRAFS